MGKPTFVQEYKSILEVLDKYNEGCARGESSIMKPSFDEKATVFSADSDGKLAGGSIKILFDALDNDLGPSPEAQSAVVRVDIVGTAASARIDTDNLAGFRFTDFFHLLKVEGEWTVVSKIFHTHS